MVKKADSIKVGHWKLDTRKLLFGGHSGKYLHCSICPDIHFSNANSQYPKQPFLNQIHVKNNRDITKPCDIIANTFCQSLVGPSLNGGSTVLCKVTFGFSIFLKIANFLHIRLIPLGKNCSLFFSHFPPSPPPPCHQKKTVMQSTVSILYILLFKAKTNTFFALQNQFSDYGYYNFLRNKLNATKNTSIFYM